MSKLKSLEPLNSPGEFTQLFKFTFAIVLKEGLFFFFLPACLYRHPTLMVADTILLLFLDHLGPGKQTNKN